MKNPSTCSRFERGFTIMELLMVMVLIAVLLGLGGPAFQSSLERNRMQSTVSGLAGSLAFARAEAVIRTQPVSMCPTLNDVDCSGSNWESGVLVFVDDGDGTGASALDGSLDGNEELLRIVDAAPVDITIRTSGFVNNSSLVFTDSGRVLQGANGTFAICDGRGATSARGLIVEVSGQARLAVDTDSNGIVQDHTASGGADLVCP